MLKAEVIKRKRMLIEDPNEARERVEILEAFNEFNAKIRVDRRDRPNRKTGSRFYTLPSVTMKLVKEF